MADNLGYTPGTGASVATDDAGVGGHVQIVKLAVSADGSAAVLPADGTYGLAVDIKRTVSVVLGAGSSVIGAVTQSGAWNVGQSGTWAVDYSNQRSWGDSYSAGHKFVPVAAVNSSGNYAYLGVNAANGGLFVTPTANTTWTTVERGATIGHSTASVTTSAAQIVASSTTRRTITIQNLGTDYVWLGATGISANNGLRLAPGQTAVIDRSPNAAVFAIASSGTQVCSIFTESD